MKFILCILMLGLCSCASSQKDIYFRTRLPTMETIDLGEPGRVGVNADLETNRFQVRATQNVTANQAFRRDTYGYLSNDGPELEGADLALTYSDIAKVIPFQLALSLDHAEIKVGLFDLRKDDKTGWVGIVNYGYYFTAAYENADNCKFLCFSTAEDRESAQKTMDGVKTSESGREQKVGTSIGYYFEESSAVFAGYNWYNANLRADATVIATNAQTQFNETFYGSGYGIGYLHHFNTKCNFAFTVEQIHLSWVGNSVNTALAGLRLHYDF